MYELVYEHSSGPTWFRWVFSVVKDQHVRGGGLGGNDAGVLRHVSGTVHLSFMVNLDFYLNLSCHRPKASKLCRGIQRNVCVVYRCNRANTYLSGLWKLI